MLILKKNLKKNLLMCPTNRFVSLQDCRSGIQPGSGPDSGLVLSEPSAAPGLQPGRCGSCEDRCWSDLQRKKKQLKKFSFYKNVQVTRQKCNLTMHFQVDPSRSSCSSVYSRMFCSWSSCSQYIKPSWSRPTGCRRIFSGSSSLTTVLNFRLSSNWHSQRY